MQGEAVFSEAGGGGEMPCVRRGGSLDDFGHTVLSDVSAWKVHPVEAGIYSTVGVDHN